MADDEDIERALDKLEALAEYAAFEERSKGGNMLDLVGEVQTFRGRIAHLEGPEFDGIRAALDRMERSALKDAHDGPPPDHAAEFDRLLAAGASCEELYEARNTAKAADPDDDRIPAMNEQLRSVGCYSRGSKRTG